MKNSGLTTRSTPALLKTPPYVTARPEVTHRKLSLPVAGSQGNTKSSIRFVVLATDGLWDELSSEEVVALVGGHLAGLKGVIPKSDLSQLVPVASGKTVEGKNKRTRAGADEDSWAFVDDNVCTHLIRNALGGGDEDKLRQMISIPTGLARSYRDDITCTVVYWEEGKEAEAKTTALSPPLAQTQAEPLKAKL